MAEKAIDFSISKVWIVGIATLLTALFIGLAGSNNAQAARVDCGTFTVLHNDRIKTVKFPKGTYDISANKLSCKQAVKLFQGFLKDPDMILRAPWVVNKNRKFARGKGSRVNFTAIPTSNPGPGPTPTTNCVTSASVRACAITRAGSTRPSSPRNHWTFQVTSRITQRPRLANGARRAAPRVRPLGGRRASRASGGCHAPAGPPQGRAPAGGGAHRALRGDVIECRRA